MKKLQSETHVVIMNITTTIVQDITVQINGTELHNLNKQIMANDLELVNEAVKNKIDKLSTNKTVSKKIKLNKVTAILSIF